MVASNLNFHLEDDGSITVEQIDQAQGVVECLRECRQIPHLCDCSIQVCQNVFYAHKAVLLSCSKFLRKYYFGHKSSSLGLGSPLCLGMLNNTDAFEAFLQFAYYSKLSLSFENIESMLALSNHLDTPSIKEACCEFLKKKLTGDNCMTVMEIAETFEIKEVVKQANKLMCKRLIELSRAYQKKGLDTSISDVLEQHSTDSVYAPSEPDTQDDEGDSSDTSTVHDVPDSAYPQESRHDDIDAVFPQNKRSLDSCTLLDTADSVYPQHKRHDAPDSIHSQHKKSSDIITLYDNTDSVYPQNKRSSDNSTHHDSPDTFSPQNKRQIFSSSAIPGSILQVETKAAMNNKPLLRSQGECTGKQSNASPSSSQGKHNKDKTIASKQISCKEKYKCSVCPKSFGKHLLLQRHKKEEHKKCRVCRKLFLNISQLEAHSKIHKHRRLKTKKAEYICSFCDKDCRNSSALRIHTRTHTGEKPFTCDQCDAKFIQSINLKRHVLSYHKKEHAHECKVCGKKFSVEIYLKSHEITHSKDRPYQCEICGDMFKRKNDLRSHSRVHSNEKPYECELCLSKFKTIGDIKTHMKIHNDEKPYVCSICGLSFKRTGHLNRHLKIHTNEKPFQCDECSATFNRKENLVNHKRKHTGEYPYRCEVCGIKYRHLSSLKSHVKKHWVNGEDHQQVLYLEASQSQQQDLSQPLASLFTTSSSFPSCVTLQSTHQQPTFPISSQDQEASLVTNSSVPSNSLVQIQGIMSHSNNASSGTLTTDAGCLKVIPVQAVTTNCEAVSYEAMTGESGGIQGMAAVIPSFPMTSGNQQVIFTALPKGVIAGSAQVPLQAVALNEAVKYVLYK